MHSPVFRRGEAEILSVAARFLPLGLAAVALVLATEAPAPALTPQSPEVRQSIARGIEYLGSEAARDGREGAKALAGIALLKQGIPSDHPKIVEAVASIREALEGRDFSKIKLDVYNTGLSIIFLVELDPDQYRADIDFLLKYLRWRQKPHGGWGYPERETGDTSMTQYGVLSSWTATQAGFEVPFASIEAVATWLLRTQDPSGGFGYQGNLSGSFVPVEQSEVKSSMTAAGLGSVNICATLLGVAGKLKKRDDSLPMALKEVKEKGKKAVRTKTRLDPQLFQKTQSRAMQWFQVNYEVAPKNWPHYYLYAMERCMSFQELIDQKDEKEPKWYNDGAKYLMKTQGENGAWNSQCGSVADTAFGVLFLMRSTKKSIGKVHNYGDGTMVGGRGLPKDTDMVEVHGGQVVTKPLLGPAEKLLAALKNDSDVGNLDETVELLAGLPTDKAKVLSSKYGEKIRSLVGNASPKARLAAVRALGKVRDLDNVGVLLYALTDPDPAVVREANESLLRISRSPSMIRLPENITEEDRRLTIEKWKTWYRAIRPNANLE